MKNGERYNTRSRLGRKGHIALLAGAAGLYMAGVSSVANHTDPGRAYITKYTGDGECLDNGPYDPSNGAIISVGNIKSASVLIVTPPAENTQRPPVLSFTIDYHTLSRPDLATADYYTGSYLVSAKCPDLPNGY